MAANDSITPPLNDGTNSSGGNASLDLDAQALLSYENSTADCDSTAKLLNPLLIANAYIYLALYAAGMACQLLIMPASFRLSRKRSAFVLLLNINVLDITWLLQQNWISVEAIIGSRLRVPYSLESYFFRFSNICLDAFYIELALNRTMAIWTPLVYQSFYRKKNMVCAVLCTWAFGIGYSIFLNFNQFRRPFHCLSGLSYYEPSSEMPKSLLPDDSLYATAQQIYLLVIMSPILLYLVTLIKMGVDLWKRTIGCHREITQTKTAPIMVNSLMPPAGAAAESRNLLASDDDIHANLIKERGRLYLICFLGTIPHFLANALWNLSMFKWITDQAFIELILFISRQSGIIFHIQQPILMFLLSKDLRAQISKDFYWVLHTIKSIFSTTSTTPNEAKFLPMQSTNLS